MNNPVDQPKVSELDATQQRIWDVIEERIDAAPVDGIAADGRSNHYLLYQQRSFVDGMRAARLAAINALPQPQATTVGDAAAKLGTLPRIISDLKAETDAHKYGSIRIDLDEVRTMLAALIGIPGAEKGEAKPAAWMFEFFRGEPSPRWVGEIWNTDPRDLYGETLARNVRPLYPSPPSYATEAMVNAFMEEFHRQGVAMDDFSPPIYPARLIQAALNAAPPAPTSERVQVLHAKAENLVLEIAKAAERQIDPRESDEYGLGYKACAEEIVYAISGRLKRPPALQELHDAIDALLNHKSS